MDDGVLLANGVSDVRLEQLLVEQVGDAKAAAAHLVFIGRADAARGGTDFDATGGVLRGQLDHAVIRKDDVGAVGEEEVAVDLDAGFAQGADFFHEGKWVEDNAISDDGFAAVAQDAAWDELEDELLAMNSDGVTGVVSAGVARHDPEIIGEDVDDFA